MERVGRRLFLDWIASLPNRSVRAIGARIGITGAAVQHFTSGRHAPNLATAFRIEDVSGGAVPARSWLELEQVDQAARAG